MPRPRNDANTLTPVNALSPEGMQREMARLRAENERLADVAVEALKRDGRGPVAEEPAPEIETKKLYFIGERQEDGVNGQPSYMVPDLRFNESVGMHHTCARGPMPIVFKGSDDDTAPHAFVPVPFGNWLIAEDCHRDHLGRAIKPRYKWAGES